MCDHTGRDENEAYLTGCVEEILSGTPSVNSELLQQLWVVVIVVVVEVLVVMVVEEGVVAELNETSASDHAKRAKG